MCTNGSWCHLLIMAVLGDVGELAEERVVGEILSTDDSVLMNELIEQ